MKVMLKSFLKAIVLAIVVIVLMASPALAISNPDSIAFYCVGSTPIYLAFYNVLETGDMLFTAEQYVHYVASPNETASEAFLFEVLNVSGNATIASTPINSYEAQPISIYFDASQVTAEGLTVGSAYILRLIGNPLLFPSETGNVVTVTLGAGDYVDQQLGEDNGVPTENPLRNYMIGVADDLETNDSPPAGSEYLTKVSGYRYLTSTGGSIFLEDIPALSVMCPILFANIVYPMEGDTPETTAAYQSTLTPINQWGTTVADGLTNLGIYLGISQSLAGILVLFILVMSFGVFVYMKTQSSLAVVLMVGATPFAGAWLGLVPLAIALIYLIVVVVLLAFYFLGRSTL